MRIDVSFKVNRRTHRVAVGPITMLSTVLREHLFLTGTKEACDLGECGSCTVLLDGRAVNSCCLPAVDADGREVLTIEGLSAGGITPLQQAFVDYGAIQCGFCTPGMILVAQALLDETPDASEREIREGLAGNLCRCTGYEKIVKAIQVAGANLIAAK